MLPAFLVASDWQSICPTCLHVLCISRQTIALDFLDSLTERFKGFPDFGKISLLQIELLIQTMNESLAQNIIEGVIAGLCQFSFDAPWW